YINTVGIDPLDDAGAPPGRVKANGVAAANGGAGATHRAFRALAIPEVANGIHISTYLHGSDASTYAGIAGNAVVTVGDAFFLSHADVVRTNFKVKEQWRRTGGRPTNRPVNRLGNHGGPFNAAVQNQPIVLQEILLANHLERAGDIVGYNQIMVSDQFYKGLLPENVIEASRIEGVPLNALLNRLSDLER
ncbi:hypothetical protein RhiirC2_801639, partial [Rhizophagus irregularis]